MYEDMKHDDKATIIMIFTYVKWFSSFFFCIEQFILDVQFLVEIGMYGGYFSSDPLLLLTLMKSTFNSAGLDPFK